MMREASLTISYNIDKDDTGKIVWTMTSEDTSPYWEYGHLELPTGYYRIKFEATNNNFRKGVELSVDDIEILPDCSCKCLIQQYFEGHV